MSLIHAVRSTSTNDKLRHIIIQDSKMHFEDFDTLYKFGKLKGWEETYPVYKAAIRNDLLRKLWSEILSAELEYYDEYLKYGKMKGWTKVVPIYGEPVT